MFDRFLREQSGGQHDAGIRSIRARSDRRNQNVAVSEIDMRFGKFFGHNFGDAIRRGPVVHHFRFGPDAGLARRHVVTGWRRSRSRMLLSATYDDRQRVFSSTNVCRVADTYFITGLAIAAYLHVLLLTDLERI